MYAALGEARPTADEATRCQRLGGRLPWRGATDVTQYPAASGAQLDRMTIPPIESRGIYTDSRGKKESQWVEGSPAVEADAGFDLEVALNARAVHPKIPTTAAAPKTTPLVDCFA